MKHIVFLATLMLSGCGEYEAMPPSFAPPAAPHASEALRNSFKDGVNFEEYTDHYYTTFSDGEKLVTCDTAVIGHSTNIDCVP